jgi:hypothetical protein
MESLNVEKRCKFMIAKVRDTVKDFLKETIEVDGVRIVRINKADGGWVAEADVAAKNQYLSSIKPEYRVFEKEHYIVKLDSNLEVSSYRRMGDHEVELEVVNYGI